MMQTPAISAGDTAWVLASSALVLLMTVGLACFYSGLVRSKNSLNTMMMSIVAMGAIGVLWVLIGYSLAFAPGSPWLGGLSWLMFKGVGLDPNPLRADDPAPGARGLSSDVRGDHAGARLRRHRRA